MKTILFSLLLVSSILSETLSFRVKDFEAKTFNLVQETTITETPIIQIDINTEQYITFRGMFEGKQIGKTLVILQSYTDDGLEYHFICENTKTKKVHSITLNLFTKLIILDNNDDFIEVYFLELMN